MLLEVKNLTKTFPGHVSGLFSRSRDLHAVDDISFSLEEGKTLGLVGESGSGKTTTGRLILRLIEPTNGSITFRGVPITNLTKREMFAMRREMQIIFQDPHASLDPVMTVGSLISEPLAIHENGSKADQRHLAAELLGKVGLSADYLDHYPHEFSGGQRQRICIARAIALKPGFIVCDEAVSSLDVSLRSQIIDLLNELQGYYGISYLFITHDLTIAQQISDNIAVMYNGKIVEMAKTHDFYANPQHPYSISLLDAIPATDPAKRKISHINPLADIKGKILHDDPNGCSFRNRCRVSMDICGRKAPALTDTGDNHLVSCHRAIH